jgi:hypothetical protein
LESICVVVIKFPQPPQANLLGLLSLSDGVWRHRSACSHCDDFVLQFALPSDLDRQFSDVFAAHGLSTSAAAPRKRILRTHPYQLRSYPAGML